MTYLRDNDSPLAQDTGDTGAGDDELLGGDDYGEESDSLDVEGDESSEEEEDL